MSPERASWLVPKIILLGFLAAYPVLPDLANTVQPDRVRMVFSAGFAVLLLGTVIARPATGIALALGLLPLLMILRISGAVYGRGLDLFYLVVVAIAVLRLEPAEEGRRVITRGRTWLLLFIGLCGLEILRGVTRGPAADLYAAVHATTFFLMVYVLSQRLPEQAFRNTLYALATGCAVVSVWVFAMAVRNGSLGVRLGTDLGVNPNLAAQFAIYLLYSLIFLSELRDGPRGALVFSAAFVAAGTIVFYSQSRLAFAQLGIIGIFLFLKVPRVRAFALAGAATVLALSFVYYETTTRILTDITMTDQYGRLSTTSAGTRAEINEFGWRLASEHPWLGVAPGNFVKHAEQEGYFDEAGEPLYHHHVIIGTAAEFGYAGLAFFLLWFARFLTSHADGRYASVFVIVIGLLAMIDGLTHGPFLTLFGAIPFMFAILIERFRVGRSAAVVAAA